MQLQDFYPIVITEHLFACRDCRVSLAFMHPSHPSAPPGPETFSGKGMCLEFQVADAGAEYARFRGGGAPIVLQLRDEPFGERRFGLFDPEA